MSLFQSFSFIVALILPAWICAQPPVEFLGLAGKPITSLGTYEAIIAVGTDGEGVFYQAAKDLPDSGWVNAGLEGKNVSAVYPHKSGPLGWTIAAGIFPEGDDSIYVHCSFMGEGFTPNSAGISHEPGVYSLAGFPDPAICGEKYAATGAALYRQPWPDSVWTVVWSEVCIEGCSVATVETSEDMGVGGFVIAGGGTGMGSPLLMKSADYGDTWEYISVGLTYEVAALDFDLNSSGTDIEKIFVSEGSRIRRSLDGGNTWNLIFEDGWNWFSEVIYDPFSTVVFIAGGDGNDTSSAVLCFSDNLGGKWTRVLLQMGGPIVGMDVASDGFLYFATHWAGVYRIALTELSTVDIPVQVPWAFNLNQPYPNPFNPTTTIEFSIPQSDFVTLTVYDLLGRDVTVLVDSWQEAGRHSVEWNASDVPSGIYLVRMQTVDHSIGWKQGFTQVRKVTVIR